MGRRTVIEKIDILRSAKLLIERYGENAWFQAAQRADELLAKGDIDGQRTWLAIHRAITSLTRIKPEEGDTIH